MSERKIDNGEWKIENDLSDLSACPAQAEWWEVALGEICELLDCLHKTPRYSDSGYPMVRVTDVKNGFLDTSNCLLVDEEVFKAFSKNHKPKIGDIVFTRVGSFGLSAIVKKQEEFCIGQNTTLLLPTNIEPSFLFYYLIGEDARFQIDGLAGGSTQPTISMANIRKIVVPYPPLPEQKAIAEVLSSLDDKIDLLHRQNKTLEQMAETLFRQWFVEEAQEDWEGYKVYDIADHIKESIKPASNPLQTYKHYSLPAFDNGLNPIIEAGREILSNKYKVIPKSILVSKLNPIVPRIWAISSDVSENAICSTEFQVFKPKKESYYEFLCFLFKSDDAVGELEMAASGTSGSHQRVKPQDILNIPFVTPSFCKIEDYSLEVLPLIEKQQRNNKYIHTLQSLRDTLLPKLMSGEVRVSLL